MLEDTLKSVKEAENRAAATVKEAEDQAAEILESARRQAQEQKEAAVRKISSTRQAEDKKREEKGRQSLEASALQTEQEIEKMKKQQVLPEMDKAVKAVLEALV